MLFCKHSWVRGSLFFYYFVKIYNVYKVGSVHTDVTFSCLDRQSSMILFLLLCICRAVLASLWLIFLVVFGSVFPSIFFSFFSLSLVDPSLKWALWVLDHWRFVLLLFHQSDITLLPRCSVLSLTPWYYLLMLFFSESFYQSSFLVNSIFYGISGLMWVRPVRQFCLNTSRL